MRVRSGWAGCCAGVWVVLCCVLPAGALPLEEEAARAIVQRWAARDLPEWTPERAKVSAPRIALAKLAVGREVAEVNEYLQSVEPWGEVGSVWWGHPEGDYDFTLTTLTAILYLFAEDEERLWPETKDHIVNELITVEGGDPQVRVPRSRGLVGETENHVLMTESSRYLKNRWLHERGTAEQRAARRYDNEANGLEAWMRHHLERLHERGFDEFNSVPYEGYSVQALLNLEAFASAGVRRRARALLDDLAAYYAVGSLDFRRSVPFRRQVRRLGLQSLWEDPLGVMMLIWCDDPPGRLSGGGSLYGEHQMLIAAALRYRPPAEAAAWAKQKQGDYFVKLGHGESGGQPGSPAIFSGGRGYLLSAGGAGRGIPARVVPRQTVLLLRDGAERIDACFHIPGAGDPWRWNNTGVHERLAVGNQPVVAPERYEATARDGGWALYEPAGLEGLSVAVHNQAGFGLLVLVDGALGESAEARLGALQEANPSAEALRGRFHWPGGETVVYDVDAPAGEWVIQEVGGEAVDRNYDDWPASRGMPW